MAIKYKMIHRKDYLNPGDKKKEGYHPQIVRKKTCTIGDLAQRISHGKRHLTPEVEANIRVLLGCIEDELLEGNNVCLDGFGTFSLTAECKKQVNDPSEIRAESISVKRVAFTPSKLLKGRLKVAEFVRVKE
jgi:Bacterial nucleoid DNA-binding protein